MSSVYGKCPICGADGVARERRLNGNTKCANGHEYPSKSAICEARPQTKKIAAAFAERMAADEWLKKIEDPSSTYSEEERRFAAELRELIGASEIEREFRLICNSRDLPAAWRLRNARNKVLGIS